MNAREVRQQRLQQGLIQQLHRELMPLLSTSALIRAQAFLAGIPEWELESESTPRNYLLSVLGYLDRRDDLEGLTKFCRFDPELPPLLRQRLDNILDKFRPFYSTNRGDYERLHSLLERGNFVGACGVLSKMEGSRPEGPGDPPPESASAKHEENKPRGQISIAREALNYLSAPRAQPLLTIDEAWHHLNPPLSATDPDPPEVQRAFKAIAALEAARPFFRQIRCYHVDREADLLCHRLRFALGWRTGSPMHALCPYQAITRYVRDDRPATAGRIALLWTAGLLVQVLGAPVGWVDGNPALFDEARLAVSVGEAMSTPERDIQEALDSARQWLDEIVYHYHADEVQGLSDTKPGVVIDIRPLEALSSDVDIALVVRLLKWRHLPKPATGTSGVSGDPT